MLVIRNKGGSDVLMELAVESPQGVQMSGANLTGADLSGMDFTGARFKSCNFTDADCRFAKFTNASFQNCVLKRANFAEAVITGADMSDANLDGAVLLSVNGSKVLLRHCRANGADFSGANLSESDCSFAELRGVFSGTNFKKSNLYSVDFTGADLSRADLREADMTGAKLRGLISPTPSCRAVSGPTASRGALRRGRPKRNRGGRFGGLRSESGMLCRDELMLHPGRPGREHHRGRHR